MKREMRKIRKGRNKMSSGVIITLIICITLIILAFGGNKK